MSYEIRKSTLTRRGGEVGGFMRAWGGSKSHIHVCTYGEGRLKKWLKGSSKAAQRRRQTVHVMGRSTGKFTVMLRLGVPGV